MSPNSQNVKIAFLRKAIRNSLVAKLTLKNYKTFCDTVADKYDELPAMQESEKWRWKKLADHVDKMFKQIQSRVKVKFVDGQPYDTADEMVKKVKDTGVMEISKGEVKAYNLHRKLAPKDTWPALFTEVIGQACYANSRGEFPEQKVSVMPMFDPVNVGNFANGKPVDPEEAKGTKGRGRKKHMSMKERGELWKKFITEMVPNTNPKTRDKFPQVQRKTLWQHGGPDRKRVLSEWAALIKSKDAGR